MELMEKFEVAFALEQSDAPASKAQAPHRWLIPELLPEVQPAAFEEFRQGRSGCASPIPRRYHRGYCRG
jgi:hypothetical protein